jgi:hypothetical protein
MTEKKKAKKTTKPNRAGFDEIVKPFFYVAAYGGSWFVCQVATKEEAKHEGMQEFGRGWVGFVRKATKDEIEHYMNVKSKDAVRV